MTDPQPVPVSTWNGTQKGLLIVGLLATLIGGIVALVAKGNGDAAAQQDALTNAVFQDGGLGTVTWNTAAGAYGVMWAGVVIAGIGVVLLIVVAAVRASQPKV